MSNYRLALKANQAEIESVGQDLRRQISLLSLEIAEKDQARQMLIKAESMLKDYARLYAMELAGGTKA